MTLVSLSAFLSGSEIALFSLSRFQLRSLKDKYKPTYKAAKRLLAEPGGLLITILLLNEVINVLISARVTETLVTHHEKLAALLPWVPAWAVETVLSLIITTPILLMLCEITPKVIAARMNVLVTLVSSRILALAFDAVKPLRILLGAIVRLFTGGSSQGVERERAQQALLKESEFLMMIEEGHREGAIEQSELELIKNVFELDDTTVSSIATPLSKVQTLSKSMSLKGALQAYSEHQFSRIPVTQGSKKNVVGVLYSKDLLKARLQPALLKEPVESLMRKPFFVDGSLRLNALFRKFKQEKIHMAIVKNDKSESVGVATMSDVLDVLIADLLPDKERT